jgi:hypothetical protein
MRSLAIPPGVLQLDPQEDAGLAGLILSGGQDVMRQHRTWQLEDEALRRAIVVHARWLLQTAAVNRFNLFDFDQEQAAVLLSEAVLGQPEAIVERLWPVTRLRLIRRAHGLLPVGPTDHSLLCTAVRMVRAEEAHTALMGMCRGYASCVVSYGATECRPPPALETALSAYEGTHGRLPGDITFLYALSLGVWGCALAFLRRAHAPCVRWSEAVQALCSGDRSPDDAERAIRNILSGVPAACRPSVCAVEALESTEHRRAVWRGLRASGCADGMRPCQAARAAMAEMRAG